MSKGKRKQTFGGCMINSWTFVLFGYFLTDIHEMYTKL